LGNLVLIGCGPDYNAQPPVTCPQPIDRSASRQENSPAKYAALFWIIGAGARPYLYKNFLKCVLRICRVSEHFHRQRIKRTAQPIVKGAKGALVAPANPCDRFLI